MRRFARGVTLGFHRLREDRFKSLFSRLGSEKFTGRLQGLFDLGGREVEAVILVVEGDAVAGSLGGVKAGPREIRDAILKARDGYLEVQSLTRKGAELDLDYNRDYRYGQPVPLQELLEPGSGEDSYKAVKRLQGNPEGWVGGPALVVSIAPLGRG